MVVFVSADKSPPVKSWLIPSNRENVESYVSIFWTDGPIARLKFERNTIDSVDVPIVRSRCNFAFSACSQWPEFSLCALSQQLYVALNEQSVADHLIRSRSHWSLLRAWFQKPHGLICVRSIISFCTRLCTGSQINKTKQIKCFKIWPDQNLDVCDPVNGWCSPVLNTSVFWLARRQLTPVPLELWILKMSKIWASWCVTARFAPTSCRRHKRQRLKTTVSRNMTTATVVVDGLSPVAAFKLTEINK